MTSKKKEQYVGTKGLTLTTSLNRVFEIMDRTPLGTKDDEYYKESKQVILQELETTQTNFNEELSIRDDKIKFLKTMLNNSQKLKYVAKYDVNNKLLDQMVEDL